MIPSPAQDILKVDSVTTGITTAGLKVSAMRLTVTFTATDTIDDDVTYRTITALASLPLT